MGRFHCHILPVARCPRELCEGRSVRAVGVHHVRCHDAPNRVHQSHTQQELKEVLGSKHTVTANAVPIPDALTSLSSDGVHR
jgi:hypothetical protein